MVHLPTRKSFVLVILVLFGQDMLVFYEGFWHCFMGVWMVYVSTGHSFRFQEKESNRQ